MKKKSVLWALLACLLVVGFVAIGCPTDSGGGGGGTSTTTTTDTSDMTGGSGITLTGTPQVGQKLTATATFTPSGNFGWEYATSASGDASGGWSLVQSSDGTKSGTKNCELTIITSTVLNVTITPLLGKYIRAVATPSGSGFKYSNVLGPVTAAP